VEELVLSLPKHGPRVGTRVEVRGEGGGESQKAFDHLSEFGFTAHIRSRGEEAKELAAEAGKRARRWVVERTHSWMNRFRRILIRWEKKSQNYLAFPHFACALIAFRAAGLFG